MTFQDDANPNCTYCHGEGEVYKYFVNHKSKEVQFDWQYCTLCFPDSTGEWPWYHWKEIDSAEYARLVEEGYTEI